MLEAIQTSAKSLVLYSVYCILSNQARLTSGVPRPFRYSELILSLIQPCVYQVSLLKQCIIEIDNWWTFPFKLICCCPLHIIHVATGQKTTRYSLISRFHLSQGDETIRMVISLLIKTKVWASCPFLESLYHLPVTNHL